MVEGNLKCFKVIARKTIRQWNRFPGYYNKTVIEYSRAFETNKLM